MAEGITGSNGLLIPRTIIIRSCARCATVRHPDDRRRSDGGIRRTGKWLATQHFGIKPDIVTCAKA